MRIRSQFIGEIVRYLIFYLEIAAVKGGRIRPALGPDIAKTFRTSQLERSQVIELANLVVSGIDPRLQDSVSRISDVLLGCASLAIANAPRPPIGTSQDGGGDRRVHSSRRAPGGVNWIAVADSG
jgi:hypothetical protein